MSFDLKHWWNLVLYFFLFKLLVSVHNLYYDIQLKLRANSACVSKTYFLLNTFSARLHPSRKYIFTKFLQKYGSSILDVLNIDENSLADTNGNKYIRSVSIQLVQKENLKMIKYITLFQYTQFRAVFKTQLNIHDGNFLQKLLTALNDFRKNLNCSCSTGF